MSCHIGSQILDPSPILEAVDKVLALAERLARAGPPHPPSRSRRRTRRGLPRGRSNRPQIGAFVKTLSSRLLASGLTVMVEPGRSIVGPAGVLLTRVLYRKANGDKEFVIVDAAMNDLIRPSLYRAHHEILPLRKNALPARHYGCGGAGLRDRRFPGARPRHGQRHARRFSGDLLLPALTASCKARTTTRAPARRRCWWKAPPGASSASARLTQDLVRGETL